MPDTRLSVSRALSYLFIAQIILQRKKNQGLEELRPVLTVTQFYIFIPGAGQSLVNRNCVFQRINERMNLIKFKKCF